MKLIATVFVMDVMFRISILGKKSCGMDRVGQHVTRTITKRTNTRAHDSIADYSTGYIART